MNEADHLFVRDGMRFSPSALTTGPWRADAMHGGPPAALAGWAIGTEVGADEYVARVNVELERPVPLVPLEVLVARRRVSGRVAHVDVTVSVVEESTVVLSARGLVLRVSEVPEPKSKIAEPVEPVPGPEAAARLSAFASGDLTAYHRDAVEHRFTKGEFFELGPTTSWIRLRQPLVAGEETSGLCRVLAAADFGSGISAIFDFNDGIGLINADLSVSLRRRPQGEFIRVAATTHLDPSGTAMATSLLADEAGELGMATQSLLPIAF